MTRAFAVAYDFLFSYGPLLMWEECISTEQFSPEMRGLDLDCQSEGGERSQGSPWACDGVSIRDITLL